MMEPGTQEWFEMADLRRRRVVDRVWIPLRRKKVDQRVGSYGDRGHIEVFLGEGSVALPLDAAAVGAALTWSQVGISHWHEPAVGADEVYLPSDVFLHGEVKGLHLVLEQAGVAEQAPEWHLHQDLVLALRLRREGDEWVAPEEGFEVVVRMERGDDGTPSAMLIRSEHMRDYLSARGMGLSVTSYRLRRAILENVDDVQWGELERDDGVAGETWEARVSPIHEGGMPFGAETSVLNIGRTDVDDDEDVPNFGNRGAGDFESTSTIFGHTGDKLFAISGELWRTEWIAPSELSPRVRRDAIASEVSFAIEADGSRRNADELIEANRYLWFRPELGMALLSVRGGTVSWQTEETGTIGCSPDYGVVFGINQVGLVTVFAKDVARLPEWQKRKWAAENVAPNGGVATELLAMQQRGIWCETVAPERRLQDALDAVEEAARQSFSIDLFQKHADRPAILNRTHRFRSTSRDKLLELAKDLARLTADSICSANIIAVLPTLTAEEKKQLRSLKLLEKLVTESLSREEARNALSNLVYVYDARISDAHLPNSKAVDALKSLGCRSEESWVHQGERLLAACAESLECIAVGLSLNGAPGASDS